MKTFWLVCAAFLVAALPAVAIQEAAAQSAASTHSSAKPLPLGEPAALARGHNVFQDHCEICHYSDSVAQKVGPGLKGLYSHGKFADGSKVTDAMVEKWVMNGSKNMPPFKDVVTPTQLRDLLSYLRSR